MRSLSQAIKKPINQDDILLAETNFSDCVVEVTRCHLSQVAAVYIALFSVKPPRFVVHDLHKHSVFSVQSNKFVSQRIIQCCPPPPPPVFSVLTVVS